MSAMKDRICQYFLPFTLHFVNMQVRVNIGTKASNCDIVMVDKQMAAIYDRRRKETEDIITPVRQGQVHPHSFRCERVDCESTHFLIIVFSKVGIAKVEDVLP